MIYMCWALGKNFSHITSISPHTNHPVRTQRSNGAQPAQGHTDANWQEQEYLHLCSLEAGPNWHHVPHYKGKRYPVKA